MHLFHRRAARIGVAALKTRIAAEAATHPIARRDGVSGRKTRRARLTAGGDRSIARADTKTIVRLTGANAGLSFGITDFVCRAVIVRQTTSDASVLLAITLGWASTRAARVGQRLAGTRAANFVARTGPPTCAAVGVIA